MKYSGFRRDVKRHVLTFSTSGQLQVTTFCTCAMTSRKKSHVSGCRRQAGYVCCLRCLMSRENLGKPVWTACRYKNSQLTITLRDLKIDWNQFFHFFWGQISAKNIRGLLNKKFAKLDEIRIGSGRDYKAWLISLFTVFTKTCLWHGNWFKLYSTTDVKKLWRAMKLIFDHTD